MPSDDYTSSTIRGSLKLKGGPSKPEGVKKKKKKPKAPITESSPALQKALEDENAVAGEGSNDIIKTKSKRKDKDADAEEEELDDEQLRELDPRGGDGKTASERAYEEMRRKRVRLSLPFMRLP